MRKPIIIKVGQVQFFKSETFTCLVVFSRCYTVPLWFVTFRRFVRGFFPACYSVGLRSCDGPYYGGVWKYFNIFTWNKWHEKKVFSEVEKGSDGPASCRQISLLSYFRGDCE